MLRPESSARHHLIGSAGGGGPIGVGVHLRGRYVEASVDLRAATHSLRNRLNRFMQGGVVVPLCGVVHVSWAVDRDRVAIEVLCALLVHRPELRARLEDGSRIGRLIEDLRTTSLQPVPHRIGVRRATTEILTAMRLLGYEHAFYGRPVPGDPLPESDEVVVRVLDRVRSSPYATGVDVDARQVRAVVEHNYLNVEPWPVQALTE